MKRATFAASLGASAISKATFKPSVAATRDFRYDEALVLSGGGARGAYEAGVVLGLQRKTGTAQRVPPASIDAVCGTSIGSINAGFIATGRYDQLRAAWSEIAAADVIRLKHRYATLRKPGAFPLLRLYEEVELTQGVATHVKGVVDGDRIQAWLDRHIDPRMPVQIPLVFTANDLRRRTTDVFYKVPGEPTQRDRSVVLSRFRELVDPDLRVHELDARMLTRAMRASIAIPALVDPLQITFDDGTSGLYVDGGAADNSPVDLARVLARRVRAVLVSPAQPPPEQVVDALGIGLTAFEIAQESILESSLRSAVTETRTKRLFEAAVTTDAQRAHLNSLMYVDLSVIRPVSPLSVGAANFNDQHAINEALERVRTMRVWDGNRIACVGLPKDTHDFR